MGLSGKLSFHGASTVERERLERRVVWRLLLFSLLVRYWPIVSYRRKHLVGHRKAGKKDRRKVLLGLFVSRRRVLPPPYRYTCEGIGR